MSIIKSAVKSVAMYTVSIAGSVYLIPRLMDATLGPVIKAAPGEMKTAEKVVRTVAYIAGTIAIATVPAIVTSKVVDFIIPD